MRPHVLIVDDEPAVLDSSAALLDRLFADRAHILTAGSTEQAVTLIEQHADTLAVAVVDYNLGEAGQTGEQLLKAIRRLGDEIYNVLNTAYGTKEMFKRGVNESWLDAIAEKEGDLDLHVGEGLERYHQRFGRRDAFLDGLVGSATAFRDSLRRVTELRRASPGKGYLLVGERGSGKQVIAELIHLQFGRSGAFHVENCASFDHNAEMQLFGVRDKAFSGVRALQGAVGAAQQGTLFLDEFHALDERTQRKLNRLIEYGDYSLYGDSATKMQSDCLIVAATNRPLQDLVQAGWLNDDLRDRFLIIEVPPLRARLDDLPGLVAHFVRKHLSSRHWDGARPEASRDTLAALGRLSWPGNVRMVENVVIEALAGYTGLKPEAFSARLAEVAEQQHRLHARGGTGDRAAETGGATPSSVVPGGDLVALVERTSELVEAARLGNPQESWAATEKKLVNGALLALCRRHGSQIEVARRLGIPRATLNARVKQAELLGIDTLLDGSAPESTTDGED